MPPVERDATGRVRRSGNGESKRDQRERERPGEEGEIRGRERPE